MTASTEKPSTADHNQTALRWGTILVGMATPQQFEDAASGAGFRRAAGSRNNAPIDATANVGSVY
jgi:hypothetical protein